MILLPRRLPLVAAAFLLFLAGCHSDAFGPLPPISEKEPAPWGHEDWQYRRAFSVYRDEIQTDEELRDFTLLLNLNAAQHADVFAGARADGADLLLTEGDGRTVLDREVATYESGAKTAEIWFRTSVLSKADPSFYLYYGNPDTVIRTPPSDAWSDAYRAIYHFSDDPGLGTLSDSSPQRAHIELDPEGGWTSADTTEGQIHQGWVFNGETHHLSSTAISTQDSSYVISAWLLHTSRGTDFFFHANPDFWHLSSQQTGDGPYPDYISGSGSATWQPNPIPFNDGYHHFAWVFDGLSDDVHFYFDGVRQDLRVRRPQGSPPLYTGRLINPQESTPVGIVGPIYRIKRDLMTGAADEFRLREGSVSAGWIRTEYRNQTNLTEFYGFGSQEMRDALIP